ncbi:MAG: nucleotidyltransferase family protein [Acidimicrobiia bacterium]
MPGVVGVVLGAGESSRLGRPKQTLPFGGRTLLAHVVGNAEQSALDRVVVVLGGAGAEAAGSLPAGRAEVAFNDAYGSGCASSLLAGLDAAGECDAGMLLLGDMPGVTAEIVDVVIRAWRAAPTWAAVTDYSDGIGHPFVFSSGAFPSLRELHGDKAVWKIVEREPASRVARIAVGQPLPHDVDTWADYERVCETFGFVPTPR